MSLELERPLDSRMPWEVALPRQDGSYRVLLSTHVAPSGEACWGVEVGAEEVKGSGQEKGYGGH